MPIGFFWRLLAISTGQQSNNLQGLDVDGMHCGGVDALDVDGMNCGGVDALRFFLLTTSVQVGTGGGSIISRPAMSKPHKSWSSSSSSLATAAKPDDASSFCLLQHSLGPCPGLPQKLQYSF